MFMSGIKIGQDFVQKNWQDIKQFLMKGENQTIDDESRVSAAVT